MIPEIFSYSKKSSVIQLSVYPIAIESCLNLFDKHEDLRIVEFGATHYKNFGWADQDNFKEFTFVSDFTDLIESEGNIGVSICHAVIGGKCTLIAHDDGRALFEVNSEKEFNRVLTRLVSTNSSHIISLVKKYEGQFVGLNLSGGYEKYSSIKHYIERHA